MSDVVTALRRPRGRPQVRPDDETRHLIAEAARAVFVASGFNGASMDEVAKAASVSKKTLYRLIPTKAELYKVSLADRIEGFVLALDEDWVTALPPQAALTRILAKYGCLTLSADTIAIQRLVLAESDRFPELATDFYQGAVVATQRVFVRCLERLRDAGVIQVDDLDEAAGMLRGMMIFEPSRAVTLGQLKPLGRAEIEERAARCARLFLDGCATKRKAAKRSDDICCASPASP